MNIIKIHEESNTTLMGIMVPIGSYYEPPELKGISHFLEHMMFKGTKTRSQLDINDSIERYGGELNAYTSEELTFYHVHVANQYKKVGLDVLKDMLFNSTFPAKEVEKEREVIIQELKRYKDSIGSEVADLFNEVYYPKSSGLYLPVIGTENTLLNINRKELIKFYEQHYQNKTLIIIGDVKETTKITQNPFEPTMVETIPKCPHKTYIREREGLSQAHVQMGADIKTEYSKLDTTIYLNLLSAIYGSMGGRLFQTIREKHHLVYGVHFDTQTYSDGRIRWQVSLGLEGKYANKARRLIAKELTKPVTKKELEHAVSKTIGTVMMALENPEVVLDSVVSGLRKNGDWKTVNNKFEKHVHRLAPTINNFIKAMHFNTNIMVGYVPKK